MKKIYVDQEAIKSNERRGEPSFPPIVIEVNGRTEKVWCLDIEGPCKIYYEPSAHGPRVYIKTESKIVDPLGLNTL